MDNDHLMDANGDELQQWMDLPDREVKARTGLHIQKIHKRLQHGDEALDNIRETLGDHEERIGDNEECLVKVKAKGRTAIETVKLVLLILTFGFMAVIGILGLMK